MRLQISMRQVVMETTARHMLSAVSSDVTPVKDGSDRISFARMESAMLMTDKATITRRRKTILMSNLEYEAYFAEATMLYRTLLVGPDHCGMRT